MSDAVFILLLASCLFVLLGWGFVTLPGERWQVMAVLPRTKQPDRSWHGLNLTYYGFFTAHAYTLAVFMAVLLLGAVSIDWKGIGILVGGVLGA